MQGRERTDSATGDQDIDLFRVVDPDELADIQGMGAFSPSPTGAGGKYFWASLEDARRYAGLVNGRFGYSPPTIVQSRIHPSLADGPQTFDLGMRGYIVPNASLGDLAPPVVHADLWP